VIPAGGQQPPPGRTVGPSTSPDSNSDLSVLSAMRVMADLAVPLETGLLRFERGSTVKDFYLVRGAPESLISNQPADRFGDYLIGRGSVRPADVERASAQLSRFAGKLGDALVGMGVLKSLDVFRLQSQYVRERVMELFSWSEGTSSFFRGQRNPSESFPLGLDSFEILGAGALALPLDFLQARFSPVAEFRPVAVSPPRINPDAFRLGTNPRALLATLDGQRTIRQLTDNGGGSDRAGLLRTLYLLIESDLARLE
jgi:serine/threonine-protein kinase